MTTRKALCNIKGLSEAKVEKIKEAAGKMLVKWDLLPLYPTFRVNCFRDKVINVV